MSPKKYLLCKQDFSRRMIFLSPFSLRSEVWGNTALKSLYLRPSPYLLPSIPGHFHPAALDEGEAGPQQEHLGEGDEGVGLTSPANPALSELRLWDWRGEQRGQPDPDLDTARNMIPFGDFRYVGDFL